MELVQNLVEYYDELYPVTDVQKKFYEDLLNSYPLPVKFLSIGCGTGVLENKLAKETTDVTGLETIKELLESASRKRRNQLMAIRFFQMSTIEMVRFLGKGFYNVISCLNNRIIFIHDNTLMRKFFFDCKQLIADNGCLIIGLSNYNIFNVEKQSEILLLEISSMRIKMKSKIYLGDNGKKYLTENLETASNKILPVYKDVEILPITKEQIIDFAKEAQFKEVKFYSGFDLVEATEDSQNLICIIK